MEKKCDFQISFFKNYVLIALEGTLTAECLIEANKALKSSPEHVPGKPELWDIRLSDLSEMDLEAVIAVSEDMSEMWQGWHRVKVAIIFTNNINIGVLNLFKEIYQRDIIQIFESFEEGEAWICE